MRHEETMMQKIVVRHFRKNYPSVIFSCAPAVASSKRQGNFNKQMGYLKGWPDLFFAIPAKGYPGLFVELKTPTGSLNEYQKHVLEQLTSAGYKTLVCRSTEEAIMQIENYLRK